MAKIVLDNVASGYDLSKINVNFQKIANEINNNALYRDNPSGDPNNMLINLDMNGKRIINLPDPILDGEAVTLGWLLEQPNNAAGSAISAADSAEQAIAAAEIAVESAENVVNWEFKGEWTTATQYFKNNIVKGTGSYVGWSFISITDHISSGATIDGDYLSGKWGVLAERGASGTGSGDLLAANNLSDVANPATALMNLGGLSSAAGAVGTTNISDNSVTDAKIDPNSKLYNRVTREVSIYDYGAVGDGIVDDTAAFNAAIADANAKGGYDRANIVGTTINLNSGRFRINSALTPIEVSGVRITADSRDSAVLLINHTDPVFYFGKVGGTVGQIVVGGGVDNVKIEYLIPPTSTSVVFYADYAFNLQFNNITILKIGRLFKLGMNASRQAGDIRAMNISGTIANAGFPLVDLIHGSGFWMSNSYVFVADAASPPAAMNTAVGTTVITTVNGIHWDTVQVSNCLFLLFYRGVSGIAQTNATFMTFYFTNTIFDYCRDSAVYLDSDGGGSLMDFRFDSNCWFVSWESSSIRIQSIGGVNDKHQFSGHSPISGTQSINYNNTTAKEISFSNMNLTGSNRLGTTDYCVLFNPNSTGFNMTNVKGNRIALNPFNTSQANYGLTIGANCDFYVVSECVFGGAVLGYNFGANTTASTNRLVHNNINANYSFTASNPAPGSGTVYTNRSALIEEFHFFGGTVTSYVKNGIQIGGAGPATFQLQPGETFYINYTAAPTGCKTVKR